MRHGKVVDVRITTVTIFCLNVLFALMQHLKHQRVWKVMGGGVSVSCHIRNINASTNKDISAATVTQNSYNIERGTIWIIQQKQWSQYYPRWSDRQIIAEQIVAHTGQLYLLVMFRQIVSAQIKVVARVAKKPCCLQRLGEEQAECKLGHLCRSL